MRAKHLQGDRCSPGDEGSGWRFCHRVFALTSHKNCEPGAAWLGFVICDSHERMEKCEWSQAFTASLVSPDILSVTLEKGLSIAKEFYLKLYKYIFIVSYIKVTFSGGFYLFVYDYFRNFYCNASVVW